MFMLVAKWSGWGGHIKLLGRQIQVGECDETHLSVIKLLQLKDQNMYLFFCRLKRAFK